MAIGARQFEDSGPRIFAAGLFVYGASSPTARARLRSILPPTNGGVTGFPARTWLATRIGIADIESERLCSVGSQAALDRHLATLADKAIAVKTCRAPAEWPASARVCVPPPRSRSIACWPPQPVGGLIHAYRVRGNCRVFRYSLDPSRDHASPLVGRQGAQSFQPGTDHAVVALPHAVKCLPSSSAGNRGFAIAHLNRMVHIVWY